MKSLAELINDTIFHKIKNQGIFTGFHTVDLILENGLPPGSLTIVSGRHGMGSTSFGISVALSTAITQQKVVSYFTGELEEREIGPRFYCNYKNYPKDLANSHSFSTRALLQLKKDAEPLLNSSILIGSGSLPNIESIFQQAQEGASDCIILDGLLSAKKKYATDHLSAIKELSTAARVATIVVLSLEPLQDDKRPCLGDLSNVLIEDDSVDVCLLLHRESFYDRESRDPSVGEVIIAKNNYGRCETIKLVWDRERSKWLNHHPS